nr:cyanophycin synthetase [uncultured Pseudodesulfovibrio sp.]
MEAAWQAVKRFGISESQAAETIRNFKPLAHRIEPVGEKKGVLYVNDSKATTLDAALAAVRSFDRPVRILMGGVWKGGNVARFCQWHQRFCCSCGVVRRSQGRAGTGTVQILYRDMG